MKQLKQEAVGEEELIRYLDGSSDFGFELQVLKMLSSRVTSCEHGGTYTDPVTKKTREFDIRALAGKEPHRLLLAIECKNVRDYFPVLVSCVPRRVDEAYHEVVLVGAGAESSGSLWTPATRPKGKTIRIEGKESFYPPGEPVGKATSQIGRTKDNNVVDNDAEVFDKWAQALSSAYDLAYRLDNDEDFIDESFRICALVPVVVVPERMLWMVSYGEDGARTTDPVRVSRVPCFIDKEYEIDRMRGSWYTVSHLELVTPSGLQNLITQDLAATLFSPTAIMASVG